MSRQLFALARTIVVSILFVSLWTWFAPRWIAAASQTKLAIVPSVPGWILVAIGVAIMLRCMWDFAWRGLGTPMPLDPPRRLVVSGLYRWVRNPMYVGMGFALVGEALLLPMIARQMLILTASLWAAVTIFIIVYEEPTLRRTFGDDYLEFCRNVRRWLPRLKPWNARV